MLVFVALTAVGQEQQQTTDCTGLQLTQGAYKFGKIKFLEFSRFSRPSKQSFPDNYKVKTRSNISP